MLENPDLAAEIENKVRENADIVLEMAAASASDDTDDAIESIPTPVSSTTKKKNVVIQADEDFEEFSPDDLM